MFAVYQNLTQHYKSTILEFKKRKEKLCSQRNSPLLY